MEWTRKWIGHHLIELRWPRGQEQAGKWAITGPATNGRGRRLGALRTGIDTATGYGKQAVDAFTPLSDLGKKYGSGTNLYLDALGVNGPEGTARAQGAFTAGAAIQGVLKCWRCEAGLGD
jgi:hypothetical protein